MRAHSVAHADARVTRADVTPRHHLQTFNQNLGATLIVVQILTPARQRAHRRRLEAALDEPMRGTRGQHKQPLDLALLGTRLDG